MSRQGRILIVDNMPEWCEELVEMLRRGGYHADSVSTIADALNRLQESFYHVLIADIRMKDTDPSNIDGLALRDKLEESGLIEATKIILFSAYGSKHMREAFTSHRIADFLSKEDFSQETLLQSIEGALLRDVRINLALEILPPTACGQAVLNLEIGGTRVKQGEPPHNQIAEELEDLLCRLFYETKGILVRSLPPGKSGASVLRAQ